MISPRNLGTCYSGQIVFIGDYRFPGGDAAAIRTLSLARIARDLGFRVTVIGKGRPRPEDYEKKNDGFYLEDIHYITMNPQRVSTSTRLRHPVRRFTLYVSALKNLNLENTRAVVINASGSAMHLPLVAAFCRKKAIPLISDVCEWYDPCQMTYGRLDPLYGIFCIAFRYFLPRFRNLIVVSNLLVRHFAGQGRRVMRIVPVLDPTKISCVNRTRTDRIVFLYAGLPGRKDLLWEMFKALAALTSEERSRVEFRLIGPTKGELMHLLGNSGDLLDLLGETVKPLGRVPHSEVLNALQEAHFTVLLRPNKRYANAGFPSKVPESLAAGVPIFLNFTSDLREFLGDETAALAVDDSSPFHVARGIRRVLAQTPTQLASLRQNARSKAEQHFDYRAYLGRFQEYLEHIH